MENTTKEIDKKLTVTRTIETIQKDLFDTIEHNFILLYQYDTGKVNIFFNRIERLFNLDFSKERPTNTNQLVDIIIKSMEKDWWK